MTLCDSTRLVIPDHYLKPQTNIRELDFEKLSNDTLFYTFYNYIEEEVQMRAVEELYRRGWRFGAKIDRWSM